MKTLARDWFEDVYKFRQLCSDALSLAKGERAEEFAHEMMRAANQYGLATMISESQLRWLCQLADHEMPQRKTP